MKDKAPAGRPASPGKSASAPGQRKKALSLKSAKTLAPGYSRGPSTKRPK